MLEELKRLLKNSGIYGLGIVMSKGISFLMIPVYTRYLAPRDFGVIEMLDLTMFFAGIFSAMGLQSAVFRFYAAYDNDRDKRRVISTAALFYAAASLATSALLIAFAAPLAGVVLGDRGFASLVRIVSVTLLFSNLTEVPLAYWRAQERSTRYVVVSLSRTVLGASLLALALAVLHRGLVGALYAGLISNLIVGTALFVVTLRETSAFLDSKKLREMLSYAVPLIPASISSFVLVFSDRFFLRHFANLSDVGIYALGYKLAMVITLIINLPFSLVWQWQQFELAKKDEAPKLYANIQLYLLIAATAFGLALSLFAKDVLRILTPSSYWGAARIVPLIAMCYVVETIRLVVTSGILVKRKTHLLAGVAVIVAVVNLGLNYVLISRYLAMGAAVATLISYILNLALCYGFARRVYAIPYDHARNLATVVAAVGLYLCGRLLQLPVAASIALNALLFAIFLAVAIAMLSKDERGMFRELGAVVARRLRRSAVATSAGGS